MSTSSIPFIVHSVVVEGGNGVEYTPRSSTAVLAWCYDGIRYHKPATNVPQHENTCCSICQTTLIIIHMHGAESTIKSAHVWGYTDIE